MWMDYRYSRHFREIAYIKCEDLVCAMRLDNSDQAMIKHSATTNWVIEKQGSPFRKNFWNVVQQIKSFQITIYFSYRSP